MSTSLNSEATTMEQTVLGSEAIFFIREFIVARVQGSSCVSS